MAYYSNFRDPFGLLGRMIRSGDRAARSALVRRGLALGARPCDFLLKGLERRLEEKARPTSHPILLIVGPPRSGTTLIYQTLASSLDVTYFSNLSELFPSAPIAATRLFGLGRGRKKPDYHSYYGNSAGLAGTNDAFHVWNRFLGANRYRAPQFLDPEKIDAMRRFFDAWLGAFDMPLLNKNNRNTDCITLLAECLPNARFIIVRRQLLYVAQSIVLARQHIQGSVEHGWGLMSETENTGSSKTNYLESVCDQVFAIDEKLNSQVAGLPADRFVEINYEDFCANPAGLVADVAERLIGEKADRSGAERELSPFKIANVDQLEPEALAQLREIIERRRAEGARERSGEATNGG